MSCGNCTLCGRVSPALQEFTICYGTHWKSEHGCADCRERIGVAIEAIKYSPPGHVWLVGVVADGSTLRLFEKLHDAEEHARGLEGPVIVQPLEVSETLSKGLGEGVA